MPIRYPYTHKSRHSIIVAGLLLGTGALAVAAAAHASRAGTGRGDIRLVEPMERRDARAETLDAGRRVAPLFSRSGRPAAAALSGGNASASVAALAAPSSTRFNLVQRDSRRYVSTGYRNFAGERSRRPGPVAGGGSGGFGGGGMSGAGTWGGGGGTAPARNAQSASSSGATRASSGRSRSGSGSRNGSGGSSAGAGQAGGAVVAGTPAASVVAATPAAGVLAITGPAGSPSPASTPEPFTMLLVGTGLAGLYGVRRRLT